MRKIKKQSAFTLIEVMVALAILSIGVVGLLGVHRHLLGYHKMAWQKEVATELAHQKLTETVSLGDKFKRSGEWMEQNFKFDWLIDQKELQKGFNQWSVKVYWGEKKENQTVELVTWQREKVKDDDIEE